MNALLDGLKALGVARLAAVAAVTFGMLGLFGLLALRGGSELMALLARGDLDLADRRALAGDRRGNPGAGAGGPRRSGAGRARQGGPARRRLRRLRDYSTAPTASPPPSSSSRSTRPARCKSSWTAQYGRSTACAGAGAPCAAPARALRTRIAGCPGVSTPGDGRGRKAGLRMAFKAILNPIAAAVPGLRPNTSRWSTAVASCWSVPATRPDQPPKAAHHGGGTPRHRVAPVARAGSNAGEKPWRRAGAPEAAGRMSFDRVNQTEERYDPDGQVTRSTQTVELEVEDHRGYQHRQGPEQPAERRRRTQSSEVRRKPGRRRPPTSRSAKPFAR